MDSGNTTDNGSDDHSEITRIAAPLVQPLACHVAEASFDSNLELIILTLGDPAGAVFSLALEKDDVSRLRAMLLGAKAKLNLNKASALVVPRVVLHCPKRALKRLRLRGTGANLEDLKLQMPLVAGFIERQLSCFRQSFTRVAPLSYSSHLLLHRIKHFVLVAVDAARSDT